MKVTDHSGKGRLLRTWAVCVDLEKAHSQPVWVGGTTIREGAKSRLIRTYTHFSGMDLRNGL